VFRINDFDLVAGSRIVEGGITKPYRSTQSRTES
jgi:hypothetical protein